MIQPKIVAIGEVLWDIFPDGARFGGAPANFACHAAQLGNAVSMVSQVGDDRLGHDAIAALNAHGVDTSFVAVSTEHHTGVVRVELDENGKPGFEIREDVAWDWICHSDQLTVLGSDADLVYFGTLAQRGHSRDAVVSFVGQFAGPYKMLDVNLRQHYYDDETLVRSLELTNLLKLSDDELPVLATACGLSGSSSELVAQLIEKYRLRLVALTLGSAGAMLYRGNEEYKCEPVPVDVVDTVGAGDSFAAAVCHGVLRDWDLERMGRAAGRLSAFVCAQSGATPQFPAGFLRELDQE